MGYDIYNNICLRYFDSVYIMLYSRMYKMDHSDIYIIKTKQRLGVFPQNQQKRVWREHPQMGFCF